MVNATRQTTLSSATTAATASPQAVDGITFYAFHSDTSLGISLQDDATQKIAFAEEVNASGPIRGASASLTDLTVTGNREVSVFLDGQTLDTTPGSASLDSTIQSLTLSVAETKTSGYLPSQSLPLTNFDRLEMIDGSASTAGLSLDLRAESNASQSAYLHTVTTGSGDDSVLVSTQPAGELSGIASLRDVRVSDITVNTGDGDDRLSAFIQQADVVLNAGAGNDDVFLLFSKATAEHNASDAPPYGHGATVTLGDGRDLLTVFSPNLVNYDSSSANSQANSINAGLVTVTDYTAGEDTIAFGNSVSDPTAVTTLSDEAFAGVTDLVGALEVSAQATVGSFKAVAFHFGGDTYVYDNSSHDAITRADSLVKLVGSQDLDVVAAGTWAGDHPIHA